MGDFFTQADDGVVDGGEAFGRLTLAAEQFDDAMPLMYLVDDVVHGADTKLRTGDDAFQAVAVVARQQRQQRKHQGDNQAELPVQIEQYANQSDDDHSVAGQDDKYVAGVADRLFGHMYQVH